MISSLGDGTLLSFKNTLSVIFIFFTPIFSACNAKELTYVSSCVEGVSGFNVVRVDERNHRYFVIREQKSRLSDDDLLKKLSVCFIKTEWVNDWSISLFSEVRFAGYKDEPNIIPLHKGNQWAKAYLAEYDGAELTMVKYPALPKNH